MAAGAGHIGIQAGTVLQLVPFDGEAKGDIVISSTHTVGVGGSSYVLCGDLQRDSGASVVVALKIFPTMLSEDSQTLLRRELSACRQFKHPLLLPFLGTSTFGLHTIIVSYYMSNGNLLEYLTRHPDADRRAFIKQVAHAVHFLHDTARYVHGDLKCHNILVSDEGTALLADFGLSTTVDDRSNEPTGIRQRNSLRFASPEILFEFESRSQEPVEEPDGALRRERRRSKTRASDVYAFGMVVLEIYTGELPWANHGVFAVIVQVREANVPPKPQLGKWGFTEHYWNLCLHCWSYYPKQRPPMRAIVHKLSEFEDGSGSYGPDYTPTIPPSVAANSKPDLFRNYHERGIQEGLGLQLGDPAEIVQDDPAHPWTSFTPPSPRPRHSPSLHPDECQGSAASGSQAPPSPTPAEFGTENGSPFLSSTALRSPRLSHQRSRSSVGSQTDEP